DDAPHILVGRTADVAAEHAVRLPGADDGDRRRRRRLFRGGWGRILLLNRLRRVAIRRRRSWVILRKGCGSCQCCTGDRNEGEQTSCAHTAFSDQTPRSV